MTVPSLAIVAHPTYGGPLAPPRQPCPCCTEGKLHPPRDICDDCWQYAIRMAECRAHGCGDGTT